MEITSNTVAEKEIIATAHKLTDFMIAQDIDSINAILDERFVLTHITGYQQPKAEWLEEIRSESMKYYGYEMVSTSVKMEGNKATFIGRNRLDARIWGTRNTWNLQQIMTLGKQGNKWIIMKSVASIF